MHRQEMRWHYNRLLTTTLLYNIIFQGDNLLHGEVLELADRRDLGLRDSF